MSDLPGTMNRVRQRIRSDVGVTQVARLRLEPSTAQVELLRGYCGTARAAYNTLLYQVRANLGQRAAQKTYDIAADDMRSRTRSPAATGGRRCECGCCPPR